MLFRSVGVELENSLEKPMLTSDFHPRGNFLYQARLLAIDA